MNPFKRISYFVDLKSLNVSCRRRRRCVRAEYKVFTSEFDEITKAENLENADEALKLRKTLDQQLIGFQDIITKLANKLQNRSTFDNQSYFDTRFINLLILKPLPRPSINFTS